MGSGWLGNVSGQEYGVPISFSNIFIVAYKEDIADLEAALKSEGMSPKVIRQSDALYLEGYSPIIRCLLNHRRVWEEIIDAQVAAVVVEADFVPVVGFGKLRVPVPIEKLDSSVAYLYACGAQAYDFYPGGYVRGHSASTVAYYCPPLAAELLCKYTDSLLKAHNPKEYWPWDTEVRVYLQERGVISFLPFRQYGEHGGSGNPEHRSAGLMPTHRADVLFGKLHFLPDYAVGSRLNYYKTRIKYRAYGVVRLFLGRYVSLKDIRRQDKPWSILWYCVRRNLAFRMW